MNLLIGPSVLSFPLVCFTVLHGVGFLLLCLHLSCHSLCGSSILCYAGAMQLALSSFSEIIALYEGVDLVCLWEVMMSGSFYAFILDLLFFTIIAIIFVT